MFKVDTATSRLDAKTRNPLRTSTTGWARKVETLLFIDKRGDSSLLRASSPCPASSNLKAVEFKELGSFLLSSELTVPINAFEPLFEREVNEDRIVFSLEPDVENIPWIPARVGETKQSANGSAWLRSIEQTSRQRSMPRRRLQSSACSALYMVCHGLHRDDVVGESELVTCDVGDESE